MPRPNRSGNSAKTDFKMVNVEFSYKEQTAANEWIGDCTIHASDIILEMIDNGYKVSLSRDNYHECYVASLTHKASSSKVKPVYLLKHNDYPKLQFILMYFYVVILNGGDEKYQEEASVLDW